MNKYKSIFGFLLLFLLFQSVSCKTREKLVYFQNGGVDSLSNINQFDLKFQTDDLLYIIVTGQEPESVIPFNLIPTVDASMSANTGYTNGIPALNGYLVDKNGNIQFPVLGELKIGGLNREEAIQMIMDSLKDYIAGPGVQIQILNYKVTVLGDVKIPGTFKIPNERITLLEAIGLAGDLNITGSRNNVLVIREEDGVKKEYRVDLTKKDFFNSPIYYLRQNDVIYVEPNVTARSESTIWRTSGGIIISLTSLIITTIVLITR